MRLVRLGVLCRGSDMEVGEDEGEDVVVAVAASAVAADEEAKVNLFCSPSADTLALFSIIRPNVRPRLEGNAGLLGNFGFRTLCGGVSYEEHRWTHMLHTRVGRKYPSSGMVL